MPYLKKKCKIRQGYGKNHIRLAIPFINVKKVGAAFNDLLMPTSKKDKKKFEELQREQEEKAKKEAEEKATREAQEKAERERLEKERAAQEKARQAEQERAERERARAQEEAQREQKRRAEQQEREQRNQQKAPYEGASGPLHTAPQPSTDQPPTSQPPAGQKPTEQQKPTEAAPGVKPDYVQAPGTDQKVPRPGDEPVPFVTLATVLADQKAATQSGRDGSFLLVDYIPIPADTPDSYTGDKILLLLLDANRQPVLSETTWAEFEPAFIRGGLKLDPVAQSARSTYISAIPDVYKVSKFERFGAACGDFVPYFGQVKNAGVVFTGYDWLLDEKVGKTERVVAAVAMLLPFVKHLKKLRSVQAAYDSVAKFGRKYGAPVVEYAKETGKGFAESVRELLERIGVKEAREFSSPEVMQDFEEMIKPRGPGAAGEATEKMAQQEGSFLAEELKTGVPKGGEAFEEAAQQSMLQLDKALFSKESLSKAGTQIDVNGLTKAGRGLEKHGSRIGSVFPKATGNIASKNAQGQKILDEILSDPKGFVEPNRFGGLNFYDGTGKGVSFYKDGTMRGFLEP